MVDGILNPDEAGAGVLHNFTLAERLRYDTTISLISRFSVPTSGLDAVSREIEIPAKKNGERLCGFTTERIIFSANTIFNV